MNTIQDILQLKDINENIKLHNHCIEHQSFDTELYKDITDMSDSIQDTVEEGNKKLKTFSDLSEDIFLNLFKYNPQMRKKEEIVPSRKFNHDLISSITGTESFNKLRDLCKLNLLNSAMGTEALHTEALKKINDIISKEQEKQKNNPGNNNDTQSVLDFINNLAEQEQQLQQKINDMSMSGGNDSNSFGAIAPNLDKNNAQQLLKEYEKKQKEIKSLKNKVSKALNKASSKTIEKVQELDNFIKAWGIDGSESASRISVEESKEALERIRNSPNLRKLTDIIGKFRNIAKNSLKHKSKGTGASIKNITVGNDISKILPTERILLSNEVTKALFYKKFNDKQLLQYEVESNNRKGLGPMIVCLDVSGSMNDGNRDVWGRALALALLEIAQRQKRNYALLMFNTRIAREWIIPKGELKPKDILDIAEVNFSGGTSFSIPVLRSIEIINREKKFSKGDIIFITDGDCSLSLQQEQELIATKKNKNILIQTIIIDIDGHCSDTGVKNWSDKIKTLSSITDLSESNAEDIFNFSIQG